jgi:hypothetical protein
LRARVDLTTLGRGESLPEPGNLGGEVEFYRELIRVGHQYGLPTWPVLKPNKPRRKQRRRANRSDDGARLMFGANAHNNLRTITRVVVETARESLVVGVL